MSSVYTCKHCGSEYIHFEVQGVHKGVFCSSCGKWIAWASNKALKSKELKEQIDASSQYNLEREKRLKNNNTSNIQNSNSTSNKTNINNTEPMYIRLTEVGLTIYHKDDIIAVPPDGFIKGTPAGLAVYDRNKRLIAVYGYDT